MLKTRTLEGKKEDEFGVESYRWGQEKVSLYPDYHFFQYIFLALGNGWEYELVS